MIKLSALLPLNEAPLGPPDPNVAQKPVRASAGARAAKPSKVQQPTSKALPTPQPSVDKVVDDVEAENDANKTENIGLESLTGLTFLLTKVITEAVDTNQIDALAASFVDHLRIKDFDAFKKSSQKFSSIEGYSQLMDSIASMVDHSGESFNKPSEQTQKGDDNGGGNNNGGGDQSGKSEMDESVDVEKSDDKDDDKPFWTQFKKKEKKKKSKK